MTWGKLKETSTITGGEYVLGPYQDTGFNTSQSVSQWLLLVQRISSYSVADLNPGFITNHLTFFMEYLINLFIHSKNMLHVTKQPANHWAVSKRQCLLSKIISYNLRSNPKNVISSLNEDRRSAKTRTPAFCFHSRPFYKQIPIPL